MFLNLSCACTLYFNFYQFIYSFIYLFIYLLLLIFFPSASNIVHYRPRNTMRYFDLKNKTKPSHNTQHFSQAVNIFSYCQMILFCSVFFHYLKRFPIKLFLVLWSNTEQYKAILKKRQLRAQRQGLQDRQFPRFRLSLD